MAETLYGTTPCPHVGHSVGSPLVDQTCPLTAQVYDKDGTLTDLHAVCAEGHDYHFGAYYLPSITPIP